MIKAFGNRILAEMIDSPDGFKKTASGLLINDKDMTTEAVRPRWFKIYATGPDVTFVSEGQYVMVAHGRWSPGVKISEDLKIYLLDNEECLMVSDENPMEKV